MAKATEKTIPPQDGAQAKVEVWRNGLLKTSVALDADETAIGRSTANTICVDDEKASRNHAILRRSVSVGWTITDLDSSNGTFVNGKKLRTERLLRHRDRIGVGDTELIFDQGAVGPDERRTVVESSVPLPRLTPAERDVLTALCRPLLAGGAYPLAATTRQVCKELVVSDSAVRHHLVRLYDKFGIYDDDPDLRRHRLATEAIKRGFGVGL